MITNGNRFAAVLADVEARSRLSKVGDQRGRPRKLVPDVPEPRVVIQGPPPPWALEARKLRRAGWTLPSLAKRLGVDQASIASALGEHLERAW